MNDMPARWAVEVACKRVDYGYSIDCIMENYPNPHRVILELAKTIEKYEKEPVINEKLVNLIENFLDGYTKDICREDFCYEFGEYLIKEYCDIEDVHPEVILEEARKISIKYSLPAILHSKSSRATFDGDIDDEDAVKCIRDAIELGIKMARGESC